MDQGAGIVLNEQATTKEKITHYFIGFVPILYFSILCGAVWVPGGDIGTFLNNFTTFIIKEHHFIVGFTSATGTFILIFESAWTLGYMYYITMFQHPFRGREYGDAKWGEVDKFTKRYANHTKKYEVVINFGDQPAPAQPVVVNTHNYWLAEGVYLNIDNKLTPNLNILVYGPPGTGKSFRVCRPILSSLTGHYFVTDPKGELYQQCGQFLEDNGYEVLVFNCESSFGMQNSIRFNPFRYLREEEDLTLLSDILFKATTPSGQQSDPFFEGKAKGLLLDAFYLMFYTYEDQDQDWKHFIELIDSMGIKSNPKTGAIDNSDENCIYQRFLRANEKWKEGAYTNGVPQTDDLKGFIDIRDLYNGAFETTAGVIESLKNHTKDMKYDSVVELLSDDDIDIVNNFVYSRKNKHSSTGKRCLFMVTSETKRQYDWITSMIYYFAIDTCYHYTTVDESLHQTLPNHLTFLMDECSNVTLPDEFVDWLSTMRSRGMSAICVWQNMHQIKKKFPENDLDKNFRANFSTVLILGGPDPDTNEELSKLFGTMTIHKQTTGETTGGQGSHSENEDVMEKKLCPPEMIGNIEKDGFMPVYVKGTNPLWAKKCQLQDNVLLPLLTRKNAYKVKEKISIGKDHIDRNKSPCEQLPDVLVGASAEAFLKQCEEEGVKVITVTDQDIDAMDILFKSKKEFIGHDPTTKEYWKQLHIQSQKVMKEAEKNRLDYDSFNEKEILVVQRLRNSGFSFRQINSLSPLIRKGYSCDMIKEYFNDRLDTEEIELFVSRLLKQKSDVLYESEVHS